jgi:hypothetical protein
MLISILLLQLALPQLGQPLEAMASEYKSPSKGIQRSRSLANFLLCMSVSFD